MSLAHHPIAYRPAAAPPGGPEIRQIQLDTITNGGVFTFDQPLGADPYVMFFWGNSTQSGRAILSMTGPALAVAGVDLATYRPARLLSWWGAPGVQGQTVFNATFQGTPSAVACFGIIECGGVVPTAQGGRNNAGHPIPLWDPPGVTMGPGIVLGAVQYVDVQIARTPFTPPAGLTATNYPQAGGGVLIHGVEPVGRSNDELFVEEATANPPANTLGVALSLE